MKKSDSKDTERLEAYKTRQQSNKDLYIVLLLTLISLTVFIVPLNKYLTVSVISLLKVFFYWDTLFGLLYFH